MRLPTRLHGILDYLLGTLLVISPWLLGFGRGGAETWVPVGAGAALVLSAFVTDHEAGALPWLQMPLHLFLDALVGVALVVSPWLLGFDAEVWRPHVALGAAVLSVAALSDTVPGYERRRARR